MDSPRPPVVKPLTGNSLTLRSGIRVAGRVTPLASRASWDAMAFLTDFLAFLKKFGVLALAVGVLLGEQVNNLEKALVDDVVMPLLDPLLPTGDWQKAVWVVAGSKVKIGHLLEATLHFVIVAFTVYVALRIGAPDTAKDDAVVKDAVAK